MAAPKLIRGLGLVSLIASVFNCTVGGGIFRLPASIFQIVGTASPLVYLACFVVMLLVVSVFVPWSLSAFVAAKSNCSNLFRSRLSKVRDAEPVRNVAL